MERDDGFQRLRQMRPPSRLAAGEGGMLEVLEGMEKPRKILIHINNTNPILDEESPERAEIEGAGIEVAYDGMDIQL